MKFFYVVEHLFRKQFVSLQCSKNKEQDVKLAFRMAEGIKKMIMKKNETNEILMLQYRIKRYQAMGNGTMCQALNGKLQKLLTKQPNLTM